MKGSPFTMGEKAKLLEGLLQTTWQANSDLVSGKRLKSSVDNLVEKFKLLRQVTISDSGISFSEEYPDTEEGLMTACTILGSLYWALAHFLGEAGAREKVRGPARKYLAENVPPGTVLGLNKYMVKLALEGGEDGPPPAPQEKGKTGKEGAQDTREGGEGAPGATGAETKGQGGRIEYGREEGERDWIKEAGKVGVTEESEKTWGTGDEEDGESGASTEQAGKEPAPDMAAQFSGTVPWLGDIIPRGCSLLVEGPGDTKERCALGFLKDGLIAGENGIALISYSPEEFRKRMKAAGFDTANVEESGKLRILDWATFRERTVNDLEDEGPVMILPKELPFVGTAVSLAMGELSDTGSPRAFINILPMALKTVAVETVFNFVQVTILKLKKKNITGLYLWEKETDPEKASMRGSFHSTVEISPLEGGRIQVKTGGPLLHPKLKWVAVKGDRYTVEKEEALAGAEDEPGAVSEFRKKMEEYRIQGYRVSKLEATLGGGGQTMKKAFDEFAKAVERMKSVRAELKIMDLSGPEILATGIPDMLKDIDQVDKAEKALKSVQEQERKKREARRAAEAAGPKFERGTGGTAAEEGGDGTLPGDGPVVVGKDGTVKFLGPPKGIDAGVREPGGAPPRGPAPVSEEARKKEFREALDKWRAEGFMVNHLEQAMALDGDRLRREFVLFRVQLGRLREMESELGAMEGPGLAPGKARVAAMLRDVSRIPDIEKGIAELRRDAGRLAEDERIRKEAERKRKAELSSKLVWWTSHGINTEALERLRDGEPEPVDRAFNEFEAEARRLLKVREELAGLDVSAVPDSARKLEAMLGDVSRAGDAEQAVSALREDIERNSRTASARRALRERLADWKARGYHVTTLEGLVEKDVAAAEVERFALGVMALEQMAMTVAGLDVRGFEERTLEVRSKLRDPAQVEEARELLKQLRHDIEKSRAEEKERAEYRTQFDLWRKRGLRTEPLEAALTGEIAALRRMAVDFRFDLEIHDRLAASLSSLSGGGYSQEAVSLISELKDFPRLGETEPKVFSLLAKVHAETVAAGKEVDVAFEKELGTLDKLRRWVADGYHVKRLEGALKGDREALRAEVAKQENDIAQLEKMASTLEVLDTTGLDAELAYIRGMLSDPDKLPAVRALVEALRLEIGRRKREEERRAAFSDMTREWKQKGYDTSGLEAALKTDMDTATREFILFKAALSAAEEPKRKLDLLDALGYSGETEALRKSIRDLEALETVRGKIQELWKTAEAKGKDLTVKKDQHAERFGDLRKRIAAWVEKGLMVRRLEKALDRPAAEVEGEFARFEEDVRRLKEFEDKLKAMEGPGFESDTAAIRVRLNDVDSIREIEVSIRGLGERMEKARRDAEDAARRIEEASRRKEAEDAARRVEGEKKASVRRRLEEKLRAWETAGIAVGSLRPALSGDLAEAEKRFAEFETAIHKGDELRLEFVKLRTRLGDDIPGADIIERLLADPTRFALAEKAVADYRRQADLLIQGNEMEKKDLERRIAVLRAKGEDVSAIELALARGAPEARVELQKLEEVLKKRDLEDTWKAIRPKLLQDKTPTEGQGMPPADGGDAPKPGGKIVKKKKIKK